jgi:hypothetical protein
MKASVPAARPFVGMREGYFLAPFQLMTQITRPSAAYM